MTLHQTSAKQRILSVSNYNLITPRIAFFPSSVSRQKQFREEQREEKNLCQLGNWRAPMGRRPDVLQL
jgi:hypothetical protein